jgi:hypothetical protein
MRSFRNNKSQRKTRNRSKQTRSRRLNVKNLIMNLSETKILTESSHHFPLNELNATTYSDTGIFVGGWTCTNRVAQGTANNQHIGNALTTVLIDYKFNLFANVNNPDTVRIMCILDLAPVGSVPVFNNMFDDPNNNLTSIAPQSTRQFKMLHDRLIDVGGNTQTVSHSFKVRKSVKTRFFNSTPTLQAIENNAIYIIVISVNGAPTECLNFWSSFVYKDI